MEALGRETGSTAKAIGTAVPVTLEPAIYSPESTLSNYKARLQGEVAIAW
jgi:hypothetical protein